VDEGRTISVRDALIGINQLIDEDADKGKEVPPVTELGERRFRVSARLPIDEVARAAGTIGYELMCALAQRVPVRAVD